MNARHWSYRESPESSYFNFKVETDEGYIGVDTERQAKLIAAAPDLLATLEQISRLSSEADRRLVDVASMLGDIARAAIARATGE